MIAFLADENFQGKIVRGVRRRSPSIDIVRVQDVGMTGADDRLLLRWAAEHGRVLLTQDVQTMIGFAWELVEQGRPMAGVIVVGRNVTPAQAIEDLVLIGECGEPDEWSARVEHLPL